MAANELCSTLREGLQARSNSGLHGSTPAASLIAGGHTYVVESNTDCSSPTASVQSPFSKKRLASPEATTGSLSTIVPSCKKTCSSFFSDSGQPQSILTAVHHHSNNRHCFNPEHTALTSAVTVDDDDDLDEAVSSFRAPPGHLLYAEEHIPGPVQSLSRAVNNPTIQSYYRSHRSNVHSSSAGILSCTTSSSSAQQAVQASAYAFSLLSLPRRQSVPANHTISSNMSDEATGTIQVLLTHEAV